MTPLATWLARFVPRPFVLPALAFIYAGMIMSLILLSGTATFDIAYIDVARP